ncbi:hypothetical protein E2320_003144, partial [Naja naja]
MQGVSPRLLVDSTGPTRFSMASVTDKSLLSAELQGEQEEDEFNRLLLQ